MAERWADLELRNEIPSDVAALVMACLSKDPAQRPQSAGAVVFFAIRSGNSRAAIMFDTFALNKQKVAEFGMRLGFDNEVRSERYFFLEQERHEVLVPIRPDRATVFFDGKELLTRKGGLSGLNQTEDSYFLASSDRSKPIFAVGSCDGEVVFHSIELKPVSADAAPPAAQVPQARQTIDLLPLIDLAKDRINSKGYTGRNNWSRSPTGSLICQIDGKAGKLIPPVAIDARTYEFEVTFQPKDPTGRLHIDLPIDAAPTTVPIILDSPGVRFVNEGAGTAWPKELPASGRVLLRCEAAAGGQSRVIVAFDGKTIGDWTGDLRNVVRKVEPHPEFPGQILTSFVCHQGSYEIQSLVLRVFDGTATVFRSGTRRGNGARAQS